MTYAQLRAFDSVAREGSFSRAAKLLGVSQPAITTQVKTLEEVYGLKLFHRRAKAVTLTEAGEALLVLTRRLFAVEAQIRELLSDTSELVQGHLRVAADGPFLVMELIADFLARYPGVHVSLTLGNSKQVLDDLLKDRCDLAVVGILDVDPRIQLMPISQQSVVVLVPRSHPWWGRGSIRLAELAGQTMVVREAGSSTQHIFQQALTRAGLAVDVRLEVGSREALREAVAAGLGLGVVLEREAGEDSRWQSLRIVDGGLASQDCLATTKGQDQLRTVQAFLGLVHRRQGSAAAAVRRIYANSAPSRSSKRSRKASQAARS